MPKTIDKYDNERKKVIDKLLNILEIDDNNDKFSLHELDSNENKQNKILELESDIKKYFICSNWTCFKMKNKINRRWLSFIKYLLKDMHIEMYTIKNIGKNEISGTIYSIKK